MTDARTPDDAGDSIFSFDVGGYIQAHYLKSGPEIQTVFDNVKNVELRPDDVMLCTYPKTGKSDILFFVCFVLFYIMLCRFVQDVFVFNNLAFEFKGNTP